MILQPLQRIFPLTKIVRSQPAYDKSYGSDPAMRYDEFPSRDDSAPFVMFWHGGSWKGGSKRTYRFVGRWLQRLGVHAIIVEYPLYPDQTFPGFIDDCKLAVRFVAVRFPDRKIFVMGHSAGAHLALITAMTAGDLPISGCISVAGPCAISPRHYKDIFGEETFEHNLQDPRQYIPASPKNMPFFLIHGRHDRIVSVDDSKSLHALLQRHGRKSTLSLGWSGHFLILMVLALRLMPGTSRKLKRFLNA